METVAHANRRSIDLPDGEGWAVMQHQGLTYWAWCQSPVEVAS